MAPELKKWSKDLIKTIFMLMDYDKIGIVSEQNFNAVMKPWSAFSACDINNDNSLDVLEMEKLFWLAEGHRPMLSRV